MKDNRCILIVPYLCAWFIISCDSLYIPDEQQNSNQIKITEILNDGAIVLGEKLEPGVSVIFAGINTSDKNAFYNSYKYDPINKPMGIIISSYDTGRQIYKEKVLSLVVCSTGREMSKPENWHETTEYDHSREITVFTYTIKQTDVAGMKIIGTPIKGGIITI